MAEDTRSPSLTEHTECQCSEHLLATLEHYSDCPRHVHLPAFLSHLGSQLNLARATEIVDNFTLEHYGEVAEETAVNNLIQAIVISLTK